MSDDRVESGPARRGLWRRLLSLGLILYFVAGGAILALRYIVLPNADSFRPRIVESVSSALGLPVEIGRVEAAWDGLAPRLSLSDVVLKDLRGRPALALSRVEALLSWQSLERGYPVFRRLIVERPELDVRRERDGELLVAVIPIGAGEDDGQFGRWLADQPEIVIADATVAWTDAARDVACFI